MGTFTELTDPKQLEEVFQFSQEKSVLLFKHSTVCPISAAAYEELKKFSESEEAANVKVVVVLVREHRPVSNVIAEQLQVKHESPQAILLKGGQVLWHDSHYNITEEALKAAVKELAER
jgi:bacillithiol system protein YtxJ